MPKPVHILIECPELIPSVSVGVIEPLKPLQNKNLCDVRFIRTVEIKTEHIVWADILITVRGSDPLTYSIVSAAKKADRFIIYYLDDDLLNIPRESSTWEYYSLAEVRENIISLLTKSDVLWGVNRNIRDLFLRYSNNRWIENRVPVQLEHSKGEIKPESQPVKILYAGSRDHMQLIRELLSPVVRSLADSYSDKVDFTFIGADPDIHDRQNVHYIPYIESYQAYRSFMREQHFDIGLAPARVDAFYACKYYNKYVEYTSIGAAGVYTNAEPYTQVVKNRENGVLCENTVRGWQDGISLLIDDTALRKKCIETAVRQIETEFNYEAVGESLIAQCPELISYHAKAVHPGSVRIHNSRIKFYAFRINAVLKKRGIAGIPEIIQKGIKKIRNRF